MDLYKYISNDTFRKVRKDDDTLGEELHFELDANGKVVRLLISRPLKSQFKVERSKKNFVFGF
jgi:hypothetical protein